MRSGVAVQAEQLLDPHQLWTACGPDHDEGWAAPVDKQKVRGKDQFMYYARMIVAAREDFAIAGIAECYGESLAIVQINIEDDLRPCGQRNQLVDNLKELSMAFKQRCELQEVMRRYKQ